MHSSYVVTDPEGEIFKTCGKMLQDAGYNIKVLNQINMEQSDFYNPLEYIRDEKDILKLINNLVANTNPINSSSNGDFWEKSEKALLLALFSYVFYEAPPDERNIGTV
jgi:type IV secretion system protein VirD4